MSFFRSVGGPFGVAIFGATFSNRLAGELARRLPAGVLARAGGGSAARSLSPRALEALPASLRHGFVQAFSNALAAGAAPGSSEPGAFGG